MKVVALDISTNTGHSTFDEMPDGNFSLGRHGIITCKDPRINYREYSKESLQAMLEAAKKMSDEILQMLKTDNVIVIEQTNKGRNRWSQKMLEFLHHQLIVDLLKNGYGLPEYLDSSRWRKVVGMQMSKEDKKHNQMIRKTGKRGKIGKKHLAVRLVNQMFNLGFKMKDNDKADSILLGVAYIKDVLNKEVICQQ